MRDDWWWFRGSGGDRPPSRVIRVKAPPRKDYHAIARDKRAVLDEILADPSVIVKVVDSENNCMCGGSCGGCDMDDVIFFDLIVRYQSVTESDLLGLENQHLLDWREIARRAPLSVDTLRSHVDEVDWDAISGSSYMYPKDAAFIRAFHDRINWERVTSLDDGGNGIDAIEELVFREKLVPMWLYCVMRALSLEQLQANLDAILSSGCCAALLRAQGPAPFDQLDDHDGALADALRGIPDQFAEACAGRAYAPRKHADVIAAATCERIEKFVLTCSPSVDYVERIVSAASAPLSKGTWRAISKRMDLYAVDAFVETHAASLDWIELAGRMTIPLKYWVHLPPAVLSRQKLDDEYIDMHADALDWYELCEHQNLSERLLRKHVDRLNWGQVSMYQAIPPAFAEDFGHRLNSVKLAMNARMKSAAVHMH